MYQEFTYSCIIHKFQALIISLLLFFIMKKIDFLLYLTLEDYSVPEMFIKSFIFSLVFQASKEEIRTVRKQLSTIGMTSEGKLRKAHIIKQLFYHRDDTLMQFKLYVDVLTLLKEFVLLFQRQDPLIHALHKEQVFNFNCSILQTLLTECIRLMASGYYRQNDLTD